MERIYLERGEEERVKKTEYKEATGPLFKADINLTNFSSTPGVMVTADDINQGLVGDCWLMAALMSVANYGNGTSNGKTH